MTSTRFMKLYGQLLKPDGVIHLKSDSNFMFTYTSEMVELNNLKVLFKTDDLYHSDLVDDVLTIKTFYEQQWIARGLNIKYIKFEYAHKNEWQEPDIEIEQDSYRSYGRSNSQILTKRAE